MTRAELIARVEAASGADRVMPLIDRLLLLLTTTQTRELITHLWLHPDLWNIAPDGEIHRAKPYPAGYSPEMRYLSWARGWGCGHHVFLPGRIAIRRATAACLRAGGE